MPVISNILSALPKKSIPSLPSLRVSCLGFLMALMLHTAPLSAITYTPLQTIKVGKTPGPVVVIPAAHLVYVLNQGASSVSVIDSNLLAVRKTIAVGTTPVAIAANPTANMVYVANSGSGTISAITGVQPAVTWTVGGKPANLVVDSALSKLFVADASGNQILILDAKKGTLLGNVPLTGQPTAMALNIATHDLWVAGGGGSTGYVAVIDGTKNQIITTLSGSTIPGGITSISVDPSTNVAVAASPTGPANDGIIAIDGANNYSVTDEPVDSTNLPMATAYNPGGDQFYISDHGDGVISFATGDGLITLGNFFSTNEIGNTSLALNTSSNQLAVVNPQVKGGFIIDLVSTLSANIVHDFNAGLTPTQMAFDPTINRFFVSNSGDNTVSAFDITPHSTVAAYEGAFGGNNVDYNYIDANPATGTVYALRLGNLFAVNELQAAVGATGQSQDAAGVTTIALGSPYSSAIVANPATNKIYVGDGAGLFYSVNGATNVATPLTVIPSSASIRALALNSAADQIIAWDYSSGSVFVLDSATDTLLKTIPLAQASQAVALADATKDLAYIASDHYYAIDPTAGTVVNSIPFTGITMAAAINPAANRFYAATTGKLIYVIDTTSNSIVTTVTLPQNPLAIAVNPATGNYYVSYNDASDVTHVDIYSGSTNTLIIDLPSSTYPELGNAVSIVVNPFANTVYVGSDSGQATNGIAAIDGATNAVSAVTSNPYDDAAHALVMDLASATLAGAGYSYTSLWMSTSDFAGDRIVPISVKMQGVSDSQTIATTPLFRTHNPKPTIKIIATSNFSSNATALVPTHAFCQLDSWQGAWTMVNLTPKAGTTSSLIQVKIPIALKTGQHILYVYAATGDVATVQNGSTGPNSAVLSPLGTLVFTIEK
jgi:YVTN family beta-propeller protein